MIYIDRIDAPLCLSDSETRNEAKWAEDHFLQRIHSNGSFIKFTRYNVYGVQKRLLEMSHRKCAYCESFVGKGTLEVEHYRPKGGVAQNEPDGYWWLALEWDNLLPSCIPCNRRLRQHIITAEMTVDQVQVILDDSPLFSYGKFTHFPITHQRLSPPSHDHAAEGALLIDPTRSDPELVLAWRNDIERSIVEPAKTEDGPSEMGQLSIDHLALNRSDLVIARTAMLDILQTQRQQIIDELTKSSGPGASQADVASAVKFALAVYKSMEMHTKPDKIFAGMARAYVRRFRAELMDMVQGPELGS